MASVDFNLFKTLWEKVEEKFTNENREPFTLESLNSIGVLLKQADWNKIKRNFEQDEAPRDINLSESAYKALYKYLGIGKLTDLDAISSKITRADNELDITTIGFLGRENELNELNKFLSTPESRILELYGVPMIGKTELINYFLDNDETAKSYKSIKVKLNPLPEDAGLKLTKVIFENRDFNDFSGFSSNTIIVIQNFEEALRWTGNTKELHDIQDKYSNIKELLKEITEVNTIKLIIESRFQINFRSFIPKARPLVRTLEIEGVEREEFWKFYRSKKFTREEFEILCSNFSNHTGLLALAYNDEDFIYRGRLVEAIYRPKSTTIYLWEYLQDIINRLEVHEIFSLGALTLLKEPTSLENLYSYLISPEVFNDRLEIDDSLRSLEKKLLVQVNREFYELNPYIRAICFTFLGETRKREMSIISNLPYFKTHGERPIYNRIHQAQERGDYMYLFNLGREARKARRYDEALEAIEVGLTIDPSPKYFLNEQALCYKETNQIDKAIEVWNILMSRYQHLPAFREKAIYYRENKLMKEAIEVLEEAMEINPRDSRTLGGLAVYYRENNQIKDAIEILERARRINPDDLIILRELAICYREKNRTNEAIEVLEKVRKIKPDDVKTLTELAMSYQENKESEKSIEIAKEAISLGDNYCYIVLANTYQRMGDIKKAYQIAQQGVEATKRTDSRMLKKLQELRNLINQQSKVAKRAKPLKVFISYSHRDEDIKERVDTFLATLKREGRIETWNDRSITGGKQWDSTVKTQLELADIILLLISQDFIQSDYIWNTELPKALERHERDEAVVIPIFCRAIDDFEGMPFAKLNGFPKNAIPIDSPDNHSALSEVAKGIRKVVLTLLEERSH
ncbi:MAG: tetratricopeptide repeat protein [Acidobacteriota bacterium]|nr:tetratricopeptide repeat protein [Acidobacteriota bacterium]